MPGAHITRGERGRHLREAIPLREAEPGAVGASARIGGAIAPVGGVGEHEVGVGVLGADLSQGRVEEREARRDEDRGRGAERARGELVGERAEVVVTDREDEEGGCVERRWDTTAGDEAVVTEEVGEGGGAIGAGVEVTGVDPSPGHLDEGPISRRDRARRRGRGRRAIRSRRRPRRSRPRGRARRVRRARRRRRPRRRCRHRRCRPSGR